MHQSHRPNLSRSGIAFVTTLSLAFSGLAPVAALTETAPARSEGQIFLPWREAGWSEREAAAHLLDRLTFGARRGDIDRVLERGLERFAAEQISGALPENALDKQLASFSTLKLSAKEIGEKYPLPPMLLRMAERQGVISRKDVEEIEKLRNEDPNMNAPGESGERRREPGQRRKVEEWAREQGFGDQRTLYAELVAQKLLRATLAENQLKEVLTDFWFNHFNVSITDNDCRVFVLPYERDAIRANVLGSFRTMLEATAKHPAMLFYLDNGRSVAAEGQPTTFDRRAAQLGRGRGADMGRGGRGGGMGGRGQAGMRGSGGSRGAQGRMPAEDAEMRERNRPQGLNENYARELMELHTLGVDGGYSQEDVIQVARAFTGWTAIPAGFRRDLGERVERARQAGAAGFIVEEPFVFRADTHDAATKKVLGVTLAAGRGIEDGQQVLDLLAAHPATARHLAGKLATRFVSDTPPQSLVDRLAATFLETRGDLRRVMVALVESPEFWARSVRGQKIKSPFELAVSALRVTGTTIDDGRGIIEWVARMGQPLYGYQAPTGFPDRADAWVNTGALLQRMNFGLQFAGGRIGGLQLDLPALDQNREPESLQSALEVYVPLLLPERDAASAVARLLPVIQDPDLARKIEESAPSGATAEMASADWEMLTAGAGGRRQRRAPPLPPSRVDSSPLAQVVGVILGSPDFQRR